MSRFFNTKSPVLQGKEFTPTTIGEALKDKQYVLVYFSASWCPPCKAFTPRLKAFYEAHKKTKNLEIIFVSLDNTDEGMRSYMKESHGDWLALPFENANPEVREWMKHYDFSSIPKMLLFERQKEDGDFRMVTNCAKEMVMRDPLASEFPWPDAEAMLKAYNRDLTIKVVITIVLAVIISMVLFWYSM